ncbi:MAG: type II 3-dehydroquinate dehydratase [Candidatus Nanopelagicaceae bacterium]|jgi:3-dehydroquinate dehydratase-2
MKILVINGPNLARLGQREPAIYGTLTYPELTAKITEWAKDSGFDSEILQSDSETEIIQLLHRAADEKLPVIINPAAFTHYSYAIRDAAAALETPLIEVHLSNPLSREEFRHTSVISGVAKGTIAGFGADSYRLALDAMAKLVR